MSENVPVGGVSQEARKAFLFAGRREERVKAGLSSWQRIGEPALVVLCVIAVWELLTRSGVLPAEDLPPASVVGVAFIQDIQHLRVWEALGSTLIAWAIGLAGSIAIGIPGGLLLGSSQLSYRLFQPSLEFIRNIPSIAALPLLILLIGTAGYRLAAAMTFLGAVWPILIQTMYGVRDVDPTTKDAGRAYGLGPIQLFTRIVLPSAFPYIATGLRLGAILGLLLSVAASLIAGGNGIGYLIINASFSGVPALVYARILLTGITGLAVTLILVAIESRLLFWHASYRRSAT
jgi:ABC-type nitrate/sulfonate/bicarbonate transport system permease component